MWHPLPALEGEVLELLVQIAHGHGVLVGADALVVVLGLGRIGNARVDRRLTLR